MFFKTGILYLFPNWKHHRNKIFTLGVKARIISCGDLSRLTAVEIFIRWATSSVATIRARIRNFKGHIFKVGHGKGHKGVKQRHQGAEEYRET